VWGQAAAVPTPPTRPDERPGPLPVASALPALVEATEGGGRAVLVAPPGAGKTTLVPGALLDAGVAGRGAVVLLQPRRVAARAVARRIAALRGGGLGDEVGYQVRFDRRLGPHTRIRVVTEGVLLAQLQRDPSLPGVGAVVLDEFHERSLHADLALALLRETVDALRDDLAVVVMSATMDPAPVARFLGAGRGAPGAAPTLQVAGRTFPVEVRYRPPRASRRGGREGSLTQRALDAVPAAVAEAVETALDAGLPGGTVLVFLPGVREIQRAARALEPTATRRGWTLAELHGRLPPAAQDAALRPCSGWRVVLSTNVAETSLTIPDVVAVVDTGLVKRPRHDASVGVGRLVTERVSRASADQRAGRAGRVRRGWAWRLWSEHDHAGLLAAEPPAVARADLARLVLELKGWGVTDPRRFDFFEAPSPQALDAAEGVLTALGAIDAPGGPITARGRALLRLPAHPRVGRFLLEAHARGQAALGAQVAAALEAGETRPREARAAPVAADVLAAVAGGPGRDRPSREARALAEAARRAQGRAPRAREAEADAICRALLAGWPDRVCRRVAPHDPRLRMVGGRGARLSPHSGVQDDELLVALDVEGGTGQGELVVRSAARVARAWLDEDPRLRVGREVHWDSARERVVAREVTTLGDLVLAEASVPLEDRREAAALLARQAARDLPRALGAPRAEDEGLLARLVSLARWRPDLSLPADREGWLRAALPALCEGRSSFGDLRGAPLRGALLAALGGAARGVLDREAPEDVAVPSGRRAKLRYRLDGPPVLAVKAQELFGATTSPRVAGGRVAVVVQPLDPAGRPLATTTDLASFWAGAWVEVRKEMRGRYPKHRWPEDPAHAEASVRTTKGRRAR